MYIERKEKEKMKNKYKLDNYTLLTKGLKIGDHLDLNKREIIDVENDEALIKLVKEDPKYLDYEISMRVDLPNNITRYSIDSQYRTVKEYLSDDRKEFIKAMKKQLDQWTMKEADNRLK